jgi:hypothetical protein
MAKKVVWALVAAAAVRVLSVFGVMKRSQKPNDININRQNLINNRLLTHNERIMRKKHAI